MPVTIVYIGEIHGTIFKFFEFKTREVYKVRQQVSIWAVLAVVYEWMHVRIDEEHLIDALLKTFEVLYTNYLK